VRVTGEVHGVDLGSTALKKELPAQRSLAWLLDEIEVGEETFPASQRVKIHTRESGQINPLFGKLGKRNVNSLKYGCIGVIGVSSVASDKLTRASCRRCPLVRPAPQVLLRRATIH